ncbi:hypothetical protein SEVIR_8G203733v4 [Setaria viridis]
MLERNSGPLSWSDFKMLCNQCFGPPLRSNPLGELAWLQFRSTMAEYQERFLALLCHADRLAPRQQVQLFTAGFPERIRIDVELQDPDDLQAAMSLVRAYKHCSLAPEDSTPSRPPRSSAWPSFPAPAAPRGAPPTSIATAPAPPLPGAAALSRLFHRLSLVKLQDYRKQDLYYNCDEQYVLQPPLLAPLLH